MEFTTDNVITAVHEFYRSSEELNLEVHDWLRACQSSREAWTLVWPLLGPTQTLNVQFTAANMLFNKVTRQLAEIPVEDLGALKENIVSAVARFVNGPAVVLTRLQLTVLQEVLEFDIIPSQLMVKQSLMNFIFFQLGAFIASTIGDIWPNPLEDLGSVFQPQNFPGIPEEKVLKLLVQVFAHVPEQVSLNSPELLI